MCSHRRQQRLLSEKERGLPTCWLISCFMQKRTQSCSEQTVGLGSDRCVIDSMAQEKALYFSHTQPRGCLCRGTQSPSTAEEISHSMFWLFPSLTLRSAELRCAVPHLHRSCEPQKAPAARLLPVPSPNTAYCCTPSCLFHCISFPTGIVSLLGAI